MKEKERFKWVKCKCGITYAVDSESPDNGNCYLCDRAIDEL